MSFKVSVVAGLSALALTLTACGGGSGASKDLTTLVLVNGDAGNSSTGAVYSSTQTAEGWDVEEGFKLKSQAVSGAATGVQMLLSGTAQLAQATGPLLYTMLAEDPSIRVVASFQGPFLGLVAREDSGIESAADLAGKTVGIFALNAGAQFLVDAAIGAEGIKKDEYKWLPVPHGAPSVEAFNSGKIDAQATWQGAWQLYSNLVDSPLKYVPSKLDDIPAQVVFLSTADVIEENRDEIVGYVRNLFKACALGLEDSERIVRDHWEIFPQVQPSADKFDEALKNESSANMDIFDSCLTPSEDTGEVGIPSDDEIKRGYEFYVEAGIVDAGLDYMQAWDKSIVEDALDGVDLEAFAEEAAAKD